MCQDFDVLPSHALLIHTTEVCIERVSIQDSGIIFVFWWLQFERMTSITLLLIVHWITSTFELLSWRMCWEPGLLAISAQTKDALEPWWASQNNRYTPTKHTRGGSDHRKPIIQISYHLVGVTPSTMRRTGRPSRARLRWHGTSDFLTLAWFNTFSIYAISSRRISNRARRYPSHRFIIWDVGTECTRSG